MTFEIKKQVHSKWIKSKMEKYVMKIKEYFF